ncbi:MAG: hypothetical protein ACOYPR_11900 [Saprospiraceae bacterium]
MLKDLMKNPFTAVLVIIVALFVIWFVLKIAVSLFWVFVLAAVVLYFVNDNFRNSVQRIFKSIFK